LLVGQAQCPCEQHRAQAAALAGFIDRQPADERQLLKTIRGSALVGARGNALDKTWPRFR